jgi:hypothetical protein
LKEHLHLTKKLGTEKVAVYDSEGDEFLCITSSGEAHHVYFWGEWIGKDHSKGAVVTLYRSMYENFEESFSALENKATYKGNEITGLLVEAMKKRFDTILLIPIKYGKPNFEEAYR